MYHNCASLSSLCKGKEGEKQFTYQLLREIQELRPTFWCLIFFLSNQQVRVDFRWLRGWNSETELFRLD